MIVNKVVSNDGVMIVYIDEFRIWKERAVTYCKVLSQPRD